MINLIAVLSKFLEKRKVFACGAANEWYTAHVSWASRRTDGRLTAPFFVFCELEEYVWLYAVLAEEKVVYRFPIIYYSLVEMLRWCQVGNVAVGVPVGYPCEHGLWCSHRLWRLQGTNGCCVGSKGGLGEGVGGSERC